MLNMEKVSLNNFSIIVDENNEVEFYSAKELNKYILLATGVDLKINSNLGSKIVIGGDYSSCKNNDGFTISVGDDITIKGNSPRGTLYGVYDFLERFFNIKFLTNYYTYIPKNCSLEIERVTYSSSPDFALRTYLFAGMKGEFSAKLRMYNEVFSTPSYCGGSLKWNDTYAQNHNLLYYVSPSIYYTDSNKEENKHMFCFNENGVPVDICYTDGLTEDGEWDKSIKTSAFSVTLENLKKLLLEDKESIYFPIEQMDTLLSCQCPNCLKAEQKYLRSGLNIRFVNALSREVKKWLKEKGIEREFYLVIFAYNYSTTPPVKWVVDHYEPLDTSVIAEDNVVVRIAPIKDNCYYPMQSDMHFAPIERQIMGWKAVCNKIMVWTYHTNYKCFLWYFPTIQHWKQDLKFLKQNGVFYNFMQSNHLEKVDWKSEMELYVASKMLWDINKEPFDIQNEFIDLFYGIASPFVKQIIDIFDKNYQLIAKDSKKLRRQFFLETNNMPLDVAYNTIFDIDKLEKMLLAESKVEWTKNVYFSLYHKEIMWAKVQPKELLEKQFSLVLSAKEVVYISDYLQEDKDRIITALEKIELSIRFMILYNYQTYYGDKDKSQFSEIFVKLCDKLDYKIIGEVNICSFSKFIDEGCNLC